MDANHQQNEDYEKNQQVLQKILIEGGFITKPSDEKDSSKPKKQKNVMKKMRKFLGI